MNWISVKESMPENDDEVLCWIAKFGTIGNVNSSYAKTLFYHEERGIWIDYYNGKEYNFEDNSDYMYITHWCKIEEPKSI